MKVILRTNDFTENFKIVEILKTPTHIKTGLTRVKYDNKIFYTGGILCRLSDIILKVLSELSNEEQWKLLLTIKFPLSF